MALRALLVAPIEQSNTGATVGVQWGPPAVPAPVPAPAPLPPHANNYIKYPRVEYYNFGVFFEVAPPYIYSKINL